MQLNWTGRDVFPGNTVLTTLDAHAAGEPLRIVTGGLPQLPGATMLDRRRPMRDHLDHLRPAPMHEPRGHAALCGRVLPPPVTPGAPLGVLSLHKGGYSTMCGHGVIALVTALLEPGALPARGPLTPVTLDTPAGLVRATGHLRADGRVERVSFRNVPSFLYERDLTLTVPGVGPLTLDIAFGGPFFATLPAPAGRVAVAPRHAPPP